MAVTEKPDLAEQRRKLPDQPGVYIFRDARRRVIYVGKAKSIRKRVASHFSSKGRGSANPGAADMVAAIDHIDFVVTATEAEALLAEQTFIKQYKPRFNIRLRDDKSYPYIAISLDDDFPRVYFTRERHRRNRAYFGHVSKEEYRQGIDGVMAFLSGRFKQIERDLERRMYFHAGEQDYEQATIERNRLQAVRALLQRQRVANEGAGTYDAVAVAAEGTEANAQVFQVRDGVLSDRQSFYLDNQAEQDLAMVAEEFLLQYYASALSIPSLLVVQSALAEGSDLGI